MATVFKRLICTVFATSLLPSIVSSIPIHSTRSEPTVSIINGTIIGKSQGGVESFLGIPFAEAPVGNLRLRPPIPLQDGFGTFDATKQATACPQFYLAVEEPGLLGLAGDIFGRIVNSELISNITNVGEDCLTLDIYRPAGTTDSSQLPVLFWIYGGGFEFGSTSEFDGTSIVQRSQELGSEIIFVAVNYRLNGFGFLAGKELTAEGSTNLGLRDQRLGLEWVAENIKSFGGNEDHVVIWGESAGAYSVFDQMMINNGDATYHGKPLFHAAIMDSGSALAADDTDSHLAQDIFDTVAKEAGCGSESSDTVLDCLRSLDYTTYMNAVCSVPPMLSYESTHLSYLPRPDPSSDFFPISPDAALLANKAYTDIPIIIGDQEDEGTAFSILQTNISTNEHLSSYLQTVYPNAALSTINALANTYPDEPLLGQPAGSPFRSGSAYNFYPQYKRLAAIQGDLLFTLIRRMFLSFSTASASSSPPRWSYISSYYNDSGTLGTAHGSDVSYAFGQKGYDNPITANIQSYYVNFVATLNPNGKSGGQNGLSNWPAWNQTDLMLLNLGKDGVDVLVDDFRQESATVIENHWQEFRY